MRRAIAIAMMGWAGTAAAQSSLVVQAPSQAPQTPSNDSGTFGVMVDLGVPDGAVASLVLRPTRALRLEAGVADNLVSPGVRGTVTWIPFATWATPVLSVGYGHYFERNANAIAQQLAGDNSFTSPLLEKVGYEFANARVGLEFGRKYVTFFLHAGVSRVTGQVHNLDQVAMSQTAKDSMVSITSTDPKVTLWGVSANLGFIVYVH
ncbi:MAG: hypothetical protein ABI591_20975 [Kofleriaceae bacterium]